MFLSSCVLVLVIPITAPAQTQGELVHTFATCTGRLSALMEHQWLTGDGDADRTQSRRADMIALLEAVMPPGQGRAVLATRIDAKIALAELLTRVSFGRDRRDATWAAGQVDIQIAACNSLLLG